MQKCLMAITLICLLLVSLSASALSASAQAEITLTALEVKLWPEYDTPEMLVIYAFDLPASTPLPVDVSFRIPAAAGQAYGYGYYPEGGGVPAQENYKQSADGGWLVVSFTMRSLSGTLEYYDPALSKTGKARHFEYVWPGDYAVTSLAIAFQQPEDATNVKLTPPAASALAGQNGLFNHTVIAGRQEAGKSYTVSLDYQKPSDRLTVENSSVQPAAPLPKNDFLSGASWWAILLAVLGLVLVIGGVGWYIFSLRRSEAATKPHHRKRNAKTAPEAAATASPSERSPTGGDGVYCHQCGRRAEASDRFCRSCGTQLRVD
jgi:hypothetical protein